jgi:hypothetical protein
MQDEARKDAGDSQAIAAALRLIKELLYTFGADGDDGIQRLLSAESALRSCGAPSVEAATFRAFHAGLTEQEQLGLGAALPAWTGEASLRPAYDTGAQAARLNARSRESNGASGWNVGPFDHPDVRQALRRAAEALSAGDARAADQG